jgi:hypothetical protein
MLGRGGAWKGRYQAPERVFRRSERRFEDENA